MNIDIFLISFFTYLLVPVVMIAKGKKQLTKKDLDS